VQAPGLARAGSPLPKSVQSHCPILFFKQPSPATSQLISLASTFPKSWRNSVVGMRLDTLFKAGGYAAV
jgi:hypothetical protein